jgi:hypothetical protein
MPLKRSQGSRISLIFSLSVLMNNDTITDFVIRGKKRQHNHCVATSQGKRFQWIARYSRRNLKHKRRSYDIKLTMKTFIEHSYLGDISGEIIALM